MPRCFTFILLPNKMIISMISAIGEIKTGFEGIEVCSAFLVRFLSTSTNI